MNISKAKKIFENIALQEGTTVEEVRKEIQNAIDIGISSFDPKARVIWDSMPKKGDKPTPEEAVVYLTKIIKKKY